MIRKLLRSRSAQKFAANRLAVGSLAIIAAYFLAALAIWFFSSACLDEALQRVGPNNVPGFWGRSAPEKRLEFAKFYLDSIDRALKRRNSQEALQELNLGGLRVASSPAGELKGRTEGALDELDALAGKENPGGHPETLAAIESLERKTAELFDRPQGLAAWMHSLRLSLGTDRQGRSIAIRAIYSIKVAIQVGLVTGIAAVLLGSFLGGAAAYFGGWVDHLVIWIYSIFSSIPQLVLLAVLVYMFTGSALEGTLLPVYFALGITSWIGPCRIVRGEVLKLKELEFAQAATAIGFGRFYILIRHILPNTAHLMLINFSLLFISAIKAEVILSFLGLGVKNEPSWGVMINYSSQEVINEFFWQIGAATAFMFVLVLAFNILTDALQDAFDPKTVLARSEE